MTKKTKFINANRRRFMQSSAVVGGAAVAGSAVADAPVQDVAAMAPSDGSNKPHAGYQLTDKVREYYRKARF